MFRKLMPGSRPAARPEEASDDAEEPPSGAVLDATSQLDAWSLLPFAARHYGDRLAVVDCSRAGSVWSYRQLHQRACRLGRVMSGCLGVRRGTRVAVMLRNRAEVLELHYAAAALHAIVVNVNVNLAPQELHHVLTDSGSEVLFAGR